MQPRVQPATRWDVLVQHHLREADSPTSKSQAVKNGVDYTFAESLFSTGRCQSRFPRAKGKQGGAETYVTQKRRVWWFEGAREKPKQQDVPRRMKGVMCAVPSLLCLLRRRRGGFSLMEGFLMRHGAQSSSGNAGAPVPVRLGQRRQGREPWGERAWASRGENPEFTLL